MSLQLVANHLAQKGRGPDSTLVHMSNREVAGLNALAKKHGGQLSVNPDTGLPEAGFLDNILPMVAGAGLTYFSGGAISPLMAGGIIGGITALDSKDLSKGLVAGLGAYGGSGMVGGLAGLGAAGAAEYGPTMAGASDAVRNAAVEQAVADGTYQSAVGAGASNFVDAPMSSLSALGGGSALKGSLPILAGLAPAAAEAFDEEDEDKPPEQHKGYIRKYALDPVTGQYKQVGAYEAGGDPNVDVSSKAGTAGAFGAVGQSEYEAAQGMAAGGTATDSERIYDYLMGRGSNPMQFTSASRPQVDYTIPKPPEPITPTTPILEEVYDQYGNRSGGGNYDPERREAELNAVNDYLNVNNDGMTLNKYFDLSPKDRADLDAKAAEASPIRAGIGKFVTTLGTPMLFRVGSALLDAFKPDPNAYKKISPPDQFEGYYPGDTSFRVPSFLRNAVSLEPSYYSTPGLTDLKNPIPEARITAAPEGTLAAGPAPTGDPAQQQAARDARIAAFDASRESSRGGGGGGMGGGEGGGSRDAGGERGYSGNNSGDNRGWGSRDAGGGDARGGYLQHGRFDQRMAHGGIANLHQYNLGSYSDGGRLLKGPGDGVSDDIPATIGRGQPARLADGEFVIPARIVSELGNGSTDAGARELYKMMDRIQAGRRKTVGKKQVAKNSKAVRHLPA